MKYLQEVLAGLILVLSVSLSSATANAKVNIFTEHQLIHMIDTNIAESATATGDYPYLGKVGLEYELDKLSYGLSFIHRSNADLQNHEYYYNGISLSIRLSNCIWLCD